MRLRLRRKSLKQLKIKLADSVVYCLFSSAILKLKMEGYQCKIVISTLSLAEIGSIYMNSEDILGRLRL